MKVETFEMRILNPRNPKDWLTNGETFSKQVILGKEANIGDWQEITNEEYLKIKTEQEEEGI